MRRIPKAEHKQAVNTYEWSGETLALVEQKGLAARSKMRDDVVHFVSEQNSLSAVCGMDMRTSWSRYPDQRPLKLFRVCGVCACKVTGAPL